MADTYDSGICHWLLTRKGREIVRSIVWAVTEDEANFPEVKSQTADFNKDVGTKIGDSILDGDLEEELLQVFGFPKDTRFEDDNATGRMEESEVPEIGDFTPEE